MAEKKLKTKRGDKLFVKPSINSPWEPARFSDLKTLLSDRETPYSKEEKLNLPQFGFGRFEGKTENTQIYPTRYIVAELDTPDPFKGKLNTDEELFKEWSNTFKSIYKKIQEDESIPYRKMYLTPSMCGLRFVMKLQKPVNSKEEYEFAVRAFLKLLGKYGVKEEYYDIKVNCGWFLPTFKNYYDLRKGEFYDPIKPLPNIDTQKSPLNEPNEKKEELDNIVEQIEEKELDITKDYKDWVNIGFALVDFLGEEGREYFQRISKFYDDYNKEVCDKQYSECIQSKGNGITIRTLFYLAQKNGLIIKTPNLAITDSSNHCFWYCVNRKGRLKIDTAKFYDFLFKEGFSKLYVGDKEKGDTPIFIHRKGNIISRCTKENIVEYTSAYINNLNIETDIRNAIRNASYSSNGKVSENNLATLEIINIPFKRDTKDKGFIYFKNCYIEISKTEIKELNYDQINGYVWKSEIIERGFTHRDFSDVQTNGVFYKFFKDICTDKDSVKTEKRLKSLLTLIGYILHGYKDPSNAKAIILMDKDKSNNPQGGTGKSLLIESLRKVKSGLVIEDGKSLNTKGRFEWANVERDTKIVAVDDLKENFKLEDLFSIITNEMRIEKKGVDKFSFPYVESPKLIFSTNYVINGVGRSFERRVIEFELSDFYSLENTPRKKFGHTFFDDWDADQWELFDNLMIYCVQLFLKEGIIKPNPINIKYRKALQAPNEDFMDFIHDHIKRNKEYNKHTIYSRFKRENEGYDNLPQKTFTKWVQEYCKICRLKLRERKSGRDRFLTIEKGNKKPISPN